MKQIVDKLNKIAKKIDESVEIPQTDLIIDSLDAITTAFGGTPSESKLIVDKLDDIASVAHGGGGTSYITYLAETTITTEEVEDGIYLVDLGDVSIPWETTPLYITFDGDDYIVEWNEQENYGAIWTDPDGFDWSTYPFSIYNMQDEGIQILTEVEGNHTIEIKGEEGEQPQIVVEELNATRNKTYTAEEGHAYNPVVVNVTPNPNVVFTGTLTVTLGNTTASIINVTYASAFQYDITRIQLTSENVSSYKTINKINDLFIMIQPGSRNLKVTVTNRSSGVFYYDVELADSKGIIVIAQDSADTITVITERI